MTVLILSIILGAVYIMGLVISLFIATDTDDMYEFWEAVGAFFSCIFWPILIVVMFCVAIYEIIDHTIEDAKDRKARRLS